MILSVNSDCFLEQHQPVDHCNGEVLCFLSDTDWIFKYYSEELRLQRVPPRKVVVVVVVVIAGSSSSKTIVQNLFNPLKPKLVEIIFKNSVRTAKKTQLFTITKINWLTLFKEIITVYSENYTKPF
jgi:hypothetical protein